MDFGSRAAGGEQGLAWVLGLRRRLAFRSRCVFVTSQGSRYGGWVFHHQIFFFLFKDFLMNPFQLLEDCRRVSRLGYVELVGPEFVFFIKCGKFGPRFPVISPLTRPASPILSPLALQ